MEIQLQTIISACIVYLGLTSVQPRNENTEQSLFSSIAKYDTHIKKNGISLKILKQGVSKERQVFDTMKEELRLARNRNDYKKRNSVQRSKAKENMVVVKRETHEEKLNLVKKIKIKNKSTKKSTTRSRSRAYKLRHSDATRLVSLRLAISRLVSTYVPRETFRTTHKYAYNQRNTRRKKYHITWDRPTKLTTKIVYARKAKPYPTHLDRRKMMYKHFVNVFSGFDEHKREFLTQMGKSVMKNDTCYMQVTGNFMRRCFYDYYYRFTGMKYIRNLLSKACQADWLNIKKINYVINGCCGEKFKFDVFPYLF